MCQPAVPVGSDFDILRVLKFIYSICIDLFVLLSNTYVFMIQLCVILTIRQETNSAASQHTSPPDLAVETWDAWESTADKSSDVWDVADHFKMQIQGFSKYRTQLKHKNSWNVCSEGSRISMHLMREQFIVLDIPRILMF